MVRGSQLPGRKFVVSVPVGTSRTKQSFVGECNINNIMARYEKDGVVAHVARVQGRYGDYTGAVDYQTACNQVLIAQGMFMTLPASIRTRFNNDPGAFLEFAMNDDNREELGKLGLLKDVPPPAEPMAVRVVEPVKASEPAVKPA